jgi:hypothetical protein
MLATRRHIESGWLELQRAVQSSPSTGSAIAN